jgi:aminopeptidase N
MDKWFALQASAPLPSVLDEVKALMKDPLFSIKNPNKVRALIGAFSANSIGFHAKDGSGYKFMAEKIMELDEINPQITSRLAKQFARWRRYDENRQSLMKQQLNKIQDKKGLSKDVFEVVSRSLGE